LVKVSNEKLFNSLFGPDSTGNPVSPVSQREIRAGFLKKQREENLAAEKESAATLRLKRFAQHKEQVDRQMLENTRMVREKMVSRSLKSDEAFRALKKDLAEGLVLANTVGEWLDNHETACKVKSRKQYETWNENVYNNIAGKITAAVEARPYKAIFNEKLKHYDAFLNVTNAKGSVFRDIIIESEYDPLIPNSNCVKVTTGVLKDPIKRSVQRTLEEHGGSGSLEQHKAKVRETLHVQEWATGKIEATPHGFFAKMMKEGGNRKPRNKGGESRVDKCLDQYNIQRGKAVLDLEFPAGKKTKQNRRPDNLVGSLS
jgi:hypothetical protein